VRNVMRASLGDDPPAITAVAVHDLPLRDARLQIEAVAV
jgi:enamine deaminase RidA (YjgF/YER057c/UK114 family)